MGDISGKSVSQFTTSSLVGMTLGGILSQVINISSLPQVIPTFAVLSVINLYSAYKSAAVIDEKYLNNNRANVVFNNYFAYRADKSVALKADVISINKTETFYLPNFINFQRCKYIRFGDFPVENTLTTD